MDELMKRSKLIDENPKFVNMIKSIIETEAQAKQESNQIELEFEESLYSGGLNISQSDKSNMKKFHEVDLKGKLNLLEKFNEERFVYFAKCILYEEFPKENLPEGFFKENAQTFCK